LEQGGNWMSFTDSVAPTEGQSDLIDNVTGALQFVNQHGGWNGMYRLALSAEPDNPSIVRFQQYYEKLPVVSGNAMTFGYMQLKLQQGTVTSYERSLVVLGDKPTNRKSRQLPGGDVLRTLVMQASQGSRAVALYPAYRPSLDNKVITLHPVWALRLANGNVKIVAESSPAVP
jgi:regulatory protein YycH of two-component signal transduction system YycFG